MKGKYPDTISEEESDLGFQKLEIANMGSLREPEAVVGKILSPSDVLVKICKPNGEIAYNHRRWGYSKTMGSKEINRWHALFAAITKEKAAILIQEYDFHPQRETFEGDTVGVPFEFRKLD
jgi:hypothetical protein